MSHDSKDTRSDFARLRQRAEAASRKRRKEKRDLSGWSADEIDRLVHELDVQHIELEMQNDELRQAQAELELARDRFTELFDLAPIGYCRLDSRGRIQEINLAGARLLGVGRIQLIARALHDFIAKTDQDRFFQHLRHGMEQLGYDQCELEMRREDGSLFDARIESVMQQEQGANNRFLTVIRDVTERKQAQRSLQEADRRKDEFLATLAHELRNPLAPIVNALHIVTRPEMSEESRQAASDIIDRQISHMVRLIDDLLDVSRIAGGKLQLRREHVDLTGILQQALEASKPRLETARHRLSVSFAEQPVQLYADPVRLTQVFVNLLNNACTYTEDGGEIRLNVGLDGQQAVVSIADTGVGIATRHLPHLFDKFMQIDDDAVERKAGLGIGLWLTRELVENHGGSIVALSDGPGRGSEFVVRLPVLTHGAPATRSQETQPEPAAEIHRRILVVDDNRDAVTSLAMFLRVSGNDVETAYDGVAAVDLAGRFRPDVILLDIGMPVLDGYGACRRIRQLPGGKEMLIIALTGWGQEEDMRKTREAGFDAHLVKPISPDTLGKLLHERTGHGSR